MTQAWLCEFHAPHFVATLLQLIGFGTTARQQLQNIDILELLQLSEDQVDGLQKVDDFDKAELKRWQKATTALAQNAGSDILIGSVQYALYTHLSDRALELAGVDIKPHDVEVVCVEPRHGFAVKAKLRVNSALLGKLQDGEYQDVHHLSITSSRSLAADTAYLKQPRNHSQQFSDACGRLSLACSGTGIVESAK